MTTEPTTSTTTGPCTVLDDPTDVADAAPRTTRAGGGRGGVGGDLRARGARAGGGGSFLRLWGKEGGMRKSGLFLLLAVSACTLNTEPLSKPGPEGAMGAEGATGPTGEGGPRGPTGATGPVGP